MPRMPSVRFTSNHRALQKREAHGAVWSSEGAGRWCVYSSCWICIPVGQKMSLVDCFTALVGLVYVTLRLMLDLCHLWIVLRLLLDLCTGSTSSLVVF